MGSGEKMGSIGRAAQGVSHNQCAMGPGCLSVTTNVPWDPDGRTDAAYDGFEGTHCRE